MNTFNHLSQLMRLWYFSSSVNSLFKCACAAIHWGYMSDFWSDTSSTSILHVCEQRRLNFLVSIYNKLFENAQFPESWALCYIISIFKGGDSKSAKNYRGITLNYILANIYSQIVLNKLTAWTEKCNKIPNCQFGYQKGKSTVDCIFILHSIIAKHSARAKRSTFYL